jgi:hypothetical protein
MSKKTISARAEAAAKAQYEAVTGKRWEDAPKYSAYLCREDAAAIADAIDEYDLKHGFENATRELNTHVGGLTTVEAVGIVRAVVKALKADA